MAESPGQNVGGGRESELLQEGTRVRVSVCDPRYNGCEGVVLRRGREAEGRVGVELIDRPNNKLSVRRDSLQVLSPRSESDEPSAGNEGEKEVGSLSFPPSPLHCNDGVRVHMFKIICTVLNEEMDEQKCLRSN